MYKENKSIIALLIFIIAILIALAIQAPEFFALQNVSDIVLNTSTILIAALGMLMVILTGQIDVSVGAILAICSAVTGILAKADVAIPIIILASLATGGLLGAINGSLVAFFKLDSIVATLGTLSIYRGLLILWTKGVWITGLSSNILTIGQGKVFKIPIPAIITFGVSLIMMYIMRYIKWGRELYAVGSNQQAAHLSGINVKWIKVSAFLFSGILIGLAGVIYATRFGGIQSNTGKGFELIVISAVVVGGASIMGGSGTVLGTVLGALLVSTIGTILIFFRISAFWEQAVQGLIILLSVASYAISTRRRSKELFRKKGEAGR